MTTITKKIDLNVSQPNNYQLVHAMQGDSSTVEILATIWDGNEPYAIDCDRISLEWQSPSGGKRDYPVPAHTRHTATFLLTKEMLAENGDYAFCLRFDNSNGDVLRTFCSTMRVMRAPFGQLMDSEVVTLTELANKAKKYYDKLLSEKGQPGGLATLDENGNVPISQLSNMQSSRFPDLTCNLLYLPDTINANSAGSASWQGGRFMCNIPSKDIRVWSGEIALPEGGYASPASSDSADVIVVYTLDGMENRVEISAGAVLPKGGVVTEYRLERKEGADRIAADIWPMISPVNVPVSEYVPYTGDSAKLNGCVAEVQKKIDDLKKSVSDGKSAVASAITDMGVSTESDATFSDLVDHIKKIIAGDAWPPNVLAGKTFSSNAGRNVSGSMRDLGDYTLVSLYSTAVGSTAYEYSSQLDSIPARRQITGGRFLRIRQPNGHSGTNNTDSRSNKEFALPLSELGDASASNVLSGKTCTSTEGVKMTGTMPNYTNVRKVLTGSNNSGTNGGYSISGNVMRVAPPTGYHDYTNTTWENALQIEVGNASSSDVLSGKRFTSSAGRNVEGTLSDLRSADAVFIGNHFSHGAGTSFALNGITHICYSKFGLHYTINTSNLGSISEYADWGCPHVVVDGGGGTINVLRSSWSIDATNYQKMVVQLYGTTKFVGSSMNLRGCIGIASPGASSGTGAEGRDYALRYGEYYFSDSNDHWKDVVVDLSGINQTVAFHMSTVHAGDIYIRHISFVPTP